MFSMMLLLLSVRLESWVLYRTTKNMKSLPMILHPGPPSLLKCLMPMWLNHRVPHFWVLLLGMWSPFLYPFVTRQPSCRSWVRMKYLCTHNSLLLLRNTFAIPKLMHSLRTSPSFLSPSLQLYDNELRNMLRSITNTLLDDLAWLQASLPVKSGGLGMSAVHLAPTTYLASFAGCRELTFTILPPHFQESPLSFWDSAISEWS